MARSRTACRRSSSSGARCPGSAPSIRRTYSALVAPALSDDAFPTPWLALLLFEEGEYDLLQGVPLEKVVPADVFTRLKKPANILCDAVEADLSLIKQIMPSKEELKLLAHARQVNIDDRELNVEGSDGWFSVIVSNRVPNVGAKCRACLVSVEERTDLVAAEPPPTYLPDPDCSR